MGHSKSRLEVPVATLLDAKDSKQDKEDSIISPQEAKRICQEYQEKERQALCKRLDSETIEAIKGINKQIKEGRDTYYIHDSLVREKVIIKLVTLLETRGYIVQVRGKGTLVWSVPETTSDDTLPVYNKEEHKV